MRGSSSYSVEGSVYEDDGLDWQYAANFNLTKETGFFKIEQRGEDRAEAVKSVLRAKDGLMTELDAMELLSHVKPDYKHDKHRWNVVALWSAVYNTGEGKMKIAANKDYGNIYTFKINEPCKVIDRESIEHSAYPDVKWSH